MDQVHCLVMFSGGIDSTVLLYEMLQAFPGQVVALTRDTKSHELAAAKRVIQALGVPHIVLRGRDEANALIRSADYDGVDPNPFLERFKNIPHICSMADSVFFGSMFGAHTVAWGWRRDEMHEHELPDDFPFFLEYLSNHNRLVGGPAIVAPYFHLPKERVIAIGRALGVPFERTYSCQRNEPVHCGECDRCRDRFLALQAL